MNTFSVTAAAWISHQDKVLSIISRVVGQAQDKSASLIVDLPSVQRETEVFNDAGTLRVTEIDIREWVNEALTEGGIINVESVRRRASAFDANELVVIRAVGFIPAVIHSMLEHLRAGLYSASVWPCAVAVVCDEALMYQVSPALANAFYARPTVLVELVIDRLTRAQARKANWLRRFGFRDDKLRRFVRRFGDWFHKRQEKKIASRLGWKWEE